MKFEESPSLKEYKDGLPEPPPDPARGHKRARVMILILAVIVLLLGTMNFLESSTGALLTGTGTVRGSVVDSEGLPFRGGVVILGTDISVETGADGSFELKRVPAGDRALVVVDSEIGHEYPIRVNAGQVLDVGRIEFTVTATP
jgi:hypothetical protein